MSVPLDNEFVLNWGIISAGNISHKFCGSLIQDSNSKLKYHKLKAVGARNLDDAKKFAEKFNVHKYYGSYDEVFEDSEVNCVYIGTLNNTHKELSLKAIQHGKNVLCEKSMAMNSKEQQEVLAKAKEKGVFFMEVNLKSFINLILKYYRINN
jgi:predicted dehydrogenase